MGPTVVVIGAPEQHVVLRTRFENEPSVSLYSEAEVLKALEAIVAHPPKILALDRAFATTSRGAALVARVKADPHMKGTDIRILTEDAEHVPLVLENRTPAVETAVLKTSHPLDYCGTRRAPRFVVGEEVGVVVNGDRGRLVNLSATGAQVLAHVRMRPHEPLRLTLVDSGSEIRLKATVAWSTAEPFKGTLGYRAGVEFINPDACLLDEFCTRHIMAPVGAERV